MLLLLLILCFECPHLRRVVTLGRNTDVEPVPLRKEIPGSYADRRRHIGDELVVIGIGLLDHGDHAFAANHVYAFARGVEKYVVAFAGGAYTSYLISRLRIQHDKHGR